MRNVQKVPPIYLIETNSEYPLHNRIILEDYFYRKFVVDNTSINTDYTYLPIQWTSIYNIRRKFEKYNKENLQKFLDTLDTNKKYFTIISHDDSIVENIDHLDILVFGQSGGVDYIDSPPKNLGYPIPLNCLPNPSINKNRDRDIFCSFIGTIDGRHTIREKMRRLYEDDFLIKDVISYDHFSNVMERSIFSLCPRGYSPTSYRICESLQHGSIPVYIYDKPWIPWKDEINFEDYGILIHESELKNLKEILYSKTNEDIEKYRINGQRIYDEYYSYDGCYKKIIEKISV